MERSGSCAKVARVRVVRASGSVRIALRPGATGRRRVEGVVVRAAVVRVVVVARGLAAHVQAARDRVESLAAAGAAVGVHADTMYDCRAQESRLSAVNAYTSAQCTSLRRDTNSFGPCDTEGSPAHTPSPESPAQHSAAFQVRRDTTRTARGFS